MIERPARRSEDSENEKAFAPANRRTKAFGESCTAVAAQAGPILLFAEKPALPYVGGAAMSTFQPVS